MNSPTTSGLRRELGLFALIAYGVGDILGAGIYALVGKIVGLAGAASWLAILIALCVAGLTALSYAELGSRYPRSGGESYFCQQAFGSPALALFIGWLVLCSGVVSLATVTRAFVGYWGELFRLDATFGMNLTLICLFLCLLGGINFWGIRQSSKANMFCTAIEASGLLLVIGVGVAYLARNQGSVPLELVEGEGAAPVSWRNVGQAAAVAFFAFIGFEDMVNVAEEVREPERNLPRAIIAALLIAGGLYLAVVWVATSVIPAAELGLSSAPLLAVVQRAAPRVPDGLFTAIAIFAVANTGLLNFIMASRLLYGMASQGLVPARLGRLHALTCTPHWSIAIVLASALCLATTVSLLFLAGTTSVLLLVVFLSVNLALVRIKRRDREPPSGFSIPMVIPVLSASACVILMVFVPPTSLLVATLVFVSGAILVLSSQKIHRQVE